MPSHTKRSETKLIRDWGFDNTTYNQSSAAAAEILTRQCL